MVAQQPEELKRDPALPAECGLPEMASQLDSLRQWIIESARQLAALPGTAAHEVERGLFQRLLALGSTLFSAFLGMVGPGDLGPTVTLDGGRVVNRLEELHDRRLLTVFGSFVFPRHVYAIREGQKIELAPTDQRLQLPEGELSYLMQEWDQMLGVEQAFGKARDTIETILRLKQSVDTLEHNNRQMAEAAPFFRAAQAPVDPAKEGELLVVTEDNKGIPMVRPVEEKPAGAHRKKGEKANKKQMATVGCVYSVDRNVRTPEELVATLFRDANRPREQPPQAQQKRYWAEMTTLVDGEELRGQDMVFAQMAEEVKTRRQPGQKMVHLCDGQESLVDDREIYLPTDKDTVEVLDLMHAIPRLWEVAYLFHAEGSADASAFVRERLLRVLNGEVGAVVAGLRYKATREGLKGAKRKKLEKACVYLKNNEQRMRYGEYLEAGYPVATGVIEGACRHLVKDRMERAGMRWQVPGAQAMLQLRAIYTNGDWEAFQAFRIEKETVRLYPHTDAVSGATWPFVLAI